MSAEARDLVQGLLHKTASKRCATQETFRVLVQADFQYDGLPKLTVPKIQALLYQKLVYSNPPGGVGGFAKKEWLAALKEQLDNDAIVGPLRLSMATAE